MKKMCRLALVFALAAVMAAPALAQRQRGDRPRGERQRGERQRGERQRGQRPQGVGFGGGSLFLLGQESVQKDLKLSEEQVTKVKDLQAKQREAFKGFRDLSREEQRTRMQEQGKATKKAVSDILKPEQQKRLEQISLQREGTRALNRKEVAEALKITDEQKSKIKTIREETFKQMGELRGGNNEDNRKKFSEIRKSSHEKVMNVLTAEQKAKLKELTGEPFTGEIRMPPFRGGERRGGQPSRR